jgi:tetratricopeptide (TPR) repeat protein
MSGGGFISYMNSITRGNRQLLKKKRKFKERSQLYNIPKISKVKYQIKDSSEEEKILKGKLKKSENDKTTIIFYLLSIIIFSISLNIYLGLFNETEEKNPSRKRLEKLYQDNIGIGDLYSRTKDWDKTVFYYKKAIEFLPEEFNGHQGLIIALTQKCKKEYESCIETRNYINSIETIFWEKKDKLENHLIKLRKVIKENYR